MMANGSRVLSTAVDSGKARRGTAILGNGKWARLMDLVSIYG